MKIMGDLTHLLNPSLPQYYNILSLYLQTSRYCSVLHLAEV